MIELEKELAALLNHHSAENESNTPDYQLAEFMVACLAAFNRGMQARDAWYAMNPEPGTDWAGRVPEQPLK